MTAPAAEHVRADVVELLARIDGDPDDPAAWALAGRPLTDGEQRTAAEASSAEAAEAAEAVERAVRWLRGRENVHGVDALIAGSRRDPAGELRTALDRLAADHPDLDAAPLWARLAVEAVDRALRTLD